MQTNVNRLSRLPCTPPDIEGFEVICIGGKLSIDGQGHLPHEPCQGSGYRYLGTLLRYCPCWMEHEGFCHKCCSQCQGPTSLGPNCHGTGYVVTADTEKLWQVAKGLSREQDRNFDFLLVAAVQRMTSVSITNTQWAFVARWKRLSEAEHQEALAGAILEVTCTP